ncbi:MAG: hypothetical protein ACOY4L_10590 [Pseudomonadota bacterium]
MRIVAVLMTTQIVAVFPALAYAQSADSTVTVGSMATYTEGKFGTDQTTRIWYVPTYFQYQTGALRLKATIPYISVESQGAVLSGGTVIGTSGSTKPVTRSGLGDIWLDGKYTIRGSGGMPDLVPYAKVKLGTASAADGLGTGKNDYETGLGLEGIIGTRIFPFATLGYRWIGKPEGSSLRDIATYDAGSSFTFGEQHVLTLMFAGRQSAQPGFPAAADAIAAWNYNLKPGSGLQVYVDKGLSDGSPDYSVGIGGQVRF